MLSDVRMSTSALLRAGESSQKHVPAVTKSVIAASTTHAMVNWATDEYPEIENAMRRPSKEGNNNERETVKE